MYSAVPAHYLSPPPYTRALKRPGATAESVHDCSFFISSPAAAASLHAGAPLLLASRVCCVSRGGLLAGERRRNKRKKEEPDGEPGLDRTCAGAGPELGEGSIDPQPDQSCDHSQSQLQLQSGWLQS